MQKFIQVPLFDTNELEIIITNAVTRAITERINSFTSTEKEEYLTRAQTAKILGIALSTLHEYTLAGKIPAYRIGSRVRYKRGDVEQSLTQIKTGI